MDFDTSSRNKRSTGRPEVRRSVSGQGEGEVVRKYASLFVLALGLSQALVGCTQPPSPAPRDAPGTTRISGTLLEKFDGPPYSYLLLKTDTGEVWAAVPVAYVDKEKPVTVLNGVVLKNYSLGSTGRRLDVVYFGTLSQSR